MADIILDIGGNTSRLDRDIQKTVNRAYNINLKTKGDQPLGRITGKVNEFTKSLDASNARVIAFGASAGIIYGLQRAFTALVSSSIEVQKSLQDINVILNASTTDLQKFGVQLFNIAKNTGQGFQEVAKAATEFSRQGLGLEETLKRTNDALILSRLSGLDAAKSVEALTAAVNSFAGEAATASEIINKFANVDAAFAVSSADLAEAISRVGSSAAQSGVSLNELIAIVTSAQQTTARGGAVIGNSFKTIFTRLERGKVQNLLETLGVSTTDSSGQLKSTIQLLQDLGKVYDTLGSQQKSYVAEQVGGVFQINILKAALADLGKEYSIYNNALNVAAGSTDQAIKRNEELNKTYASQINALQENARQLAATAGERLLGPSIDRVVGGSNAILGGLNADEGKGFGAQLGKGILDGIGQFISGPGLVLIGGVLLKLFKDLGKFATGSVQQLLGLNTSATQQRDLQASIGQILQKNPQLIDLALKGEQGLNAAAAQLLVNLQKQTLELQKQEQVALQLSKAFMQSGVRVTGGVPVAPIKKGGKASGYIPNFASDKQIEKAQAVALGATPSVRAHMSEGTIGGRKFVMNSQETEYPGVGRNGDSMVIPHYGDSVQMAARGFVPNFAGGAKQNADFLNLGKNQFIAKYSKSEYAARMAAQKEGIQYSEYEKRSKLQKAEKQKEKQLSKERSRRGILKSTVSDFAVIVASGPKSKEENIANFLPTSKALKTYTDRGFDPNKMSFLQGGFGVYGLEDRADEPEKSKFEDIVRQNVDVAGRDITTYVANAFGKKGKIGQQGLGKKHQDQISALAGFLFEDVASAFLTGPEFDQYTNTPANARFDFASSPQTLKDLFNIKGNPKIEAKLNAGPSLMSSSSNSSSMANKIYSVLGSNQPSALKKNKASGYIPNFAAIQDAVSRERAAGIPSSQIYLAQEQALTSTNPMGLGVFNKQDEPTKGSRKDAMRRKGFARGYIPNFALANQDTEAADFSTILATVGTQLSGLGFAFAFTKDDYKNSLSEITDANKKAGKVQREITKQQKAEFYKQEKATGEPGAVTRAEARINEAKYAPGKGQKVGAFLGNNALGLSIAAPILGETVKNLAGDQTKGRRQVGSVGSAVGQIGAFAGTGAMIAGPGPQAALGAAIGGVVGAALSAGDVLDAFVSDFTDFQKSADVAAKELNKFNESSSKMVQAAEKYQSLLDKGGTSIDTLNKAQAELANSLKDIPTKYQSQLLEGIKQGNFSQVQAEIGSKLQSDASSKQSQASRQGLVDDVRKGGIGKSIAKFFDFTAFRGVKVLKNLTEDLTSGRMPTAQSFRGASDDINPTAETFTKTTVSGRQNRETAKTDFLNSITKGQTTEKSLNTLKNIKLPTVFTNDFTAEGKKAASEIFTGIETPADFSKFLTNLKNVDGGQALSDIDIKQWLEMAQDGSLGLATTVGLFNDAVTEGIPQYEESIKNAKEVADATKQRNAALEKERTAMDALLKSLQTNIAITNTWKSALQNFGENSRKFQEDIRISNEYTAPKEAMSEIFSSGSQISGITGTSNIEKKFEVGGEMAKIQNEFAGSVNSSMNEFKDAIRTAIAVPFQEKFDKNITDVSSGGSFEGVATDKIGIKGAEIRDQAGTEQGKLNDTMSSMESLMQQYVQGQISTQSFQQQSVAALQKVGIGVDASSKVGNDIQLAVAQSGTKLLAAAQVAQQQRKLLATEQVQKLIQEKIQQGLGLFGGIESFMNRPNDAPQGEFKKIEPTLDKIRDIRSGTEFRYNNKESIEKQKEKSPELARKYIELYQNFNKMSGGAFRNELQQRVDSGVVDKTQGRGSYTSQTGGFDDIIKGIKDDLEAQVKQYEDQIKIEKDPGIKKDLEMFVKSIKGVGIDKASKLQAMAATGVARQSDYAETYGSYENSAIEQLSKQFPQLASEISKGVGFDQNNPLLAQASTQSALQGQMVNFLAGIQDAIIKTAQGKTGEIQGYNPEEMIKQMTAQADAGQAMENKTGAVDLKQQKPGEVRPVESKAKNMDDRLADWTIRETASQGKKLPSVEDLKKMYPDYSGYMSSESQKLMGPQATKDAGQLAEKTKPIEKSFTTQEAALSQNTTAMGNLTTAINGLQTSLTTTQETKANAPVSAQNAGTPNISSQTNAPVNVVVNAQGGGDMATAVGAAVQSAIPQIIEKVRLAMGEKIPPSVPKKPAMSDATGGL